MDKGIKGKDWLHVNKQPFSILVWPCSLPDQCSLSSPNAPNSISDCFSEKGVFHHMCM